MEKKFRCEEIIQEYVDTYDSKIHSNTTKEEKRFFCILNPKKSNSNISFRINEF